MTNTETAKVIQLNARREVPGRITAANIWKPVNGCDQHPAYEADNCPACGTSRSI